MRSIVFVQPLLIGLFEILSLFIVAKSQAQSTGWQEITISDGLSQGMIYEIRQDERGFMWIGTNDGLNRYDGQHFKVFTHDPYDEYSISGNTCTALLIDSKKRLWVGTQTAGLNLYNQATHRFYHIDLKTKNQLNPPIGTIKEDPQGNIWVYNFDGELFKIVLNDSLKTSFPKQANFTKSVKVLSLGKVSSSREAASFVFAPQGPAYVCDKEHFYTFNWTNPTLFTRIQPDSLKISAALFQNQVKQNRLWVTPVSLRLLSQKRKAVSLWAEKSRKNNTFFTFTNQGHLIIYTLNKVWLFQHPDELLTDNPLSDDQCLMVLPENEGVHTCFEDNRGIIWVGTNGYGLRKFNPQVRKFRRYLSNLSMTNVYQDQQGRNYVRFNIRYHLVDKQTNTTKDLPQNQAIPLGQLSDCDLIQARNQDFWMANIAEKKGIAVRSYLARYNQDWRLKKKYFLPINVSWVSTGTRLIEDQKGQIWGVAADGKVICFDPMTEQLKVFDYSSLLVTYSSGTEPTSLYIDLDGVFWIGTMAGLVKMNVKGNVPQFTLYSNSRRNPQGLINNFVSCVIDDPYQPHRYLWVSTKGGGLERLDKQKGTFEHFTEKQGLPNKVVYGILQDERKNLWMSTNRGLSQLNPKTLTFKNYTKADGLQDDEFNTNAFFKAPTGELLFGGVNGLNIFRASEVQSNDRKPTVQIVELKINNQSVEVGDDTQILSKSIEHTPSITLNHDQNQLSFELAVMDLTNPAKNRYRYQLVGISKRWIELGTNRTLTFSQLSSGNYTLQVSGSANGELWSDPVTLSFRIKPPFYATWWAYIVYLALIASLIWRWNQTRTHRLLLQQELIFKEKEVTQKAELDQLKTRFFDNITHEFRTPLTLIVEPMRQLLKTDDWAVVRSQANIVFHNANRLLGLVNQLLDIAKLEKGKAQAHFVEGDLLPIIHDVFASFAPLATKKHQQLRWVSDLNALNGINDRQLLEKVLFNLLSNALKFTPEGGTITVNVSQVPADHWQLSVKDTGVGIAAAQLPHIFDRFYQADGSHTRRGEGTGIGLALVRELLELVEGTIEVQSTLGAGSHFVVTFPRHPASTASVQSLALPNSPWENPLVEEETPTTANQKPKEGTKQDKTVLVVEDNAEMRQYLHLVLQQKGYTVLEAANGAAGVEVAKEHLPDLIISDIMMPEKDGYELTDLLKNDLLTAHIPIVLLTAKSKLDSKLEGYRRGADAYLPKPFHTEELLIRMQQLLEVRQALQQKYASSEAVAEWKNLATPAEEDAAQPSPLDVAFIERIYQYLSDNLQNDQVVIEDLTQEFAMSRSQLFRKIKSLTGKTPAQLVRDYRLDAAHRLLQQDPTLRVSEAMFAVGFNDPKHFGQIFKDRFGVSPQALKK